MCIALNADSSTMAGDMGLVETSTLAQNQFPTFIQGHYKTSGTQIIRNLD